MTESTESNIGIVKYEITAYDQFRADLAKLKEENAKTVFQYEHPAGNKAARSYVHKLRLSKGAVERAREAEKAEYLKRGRLIDSEAREIKDQIDEMIAVHKKPLDEIEEKEKERVRLIREQIDSIIEQGNSTDSEKSEAIKARLAKVQNITIDVSFAEFQDEALEAKEVAVKSLEIAVSATEKREHDARELERLRKAEEERKQKEHDDRIKKEAAEKAKKEAEEKAAKEKAEAEAKAKAEKEAIERKAREEREVIEKEKAETERKAEAERQAAKRREEEHQAELARKEREKQDAIEAERLRIQKEKDEEAAAEAKREANKKHQAKIHQDIIKAMKEYCGVSDAASRKLITAIRRQEIPHMQINY